MKIRTNKKLISLVIPTYNEVESLPFLFVELQKLTQELHSQYVFEIIFVDDGSQDESFSLLTEYQYILPFKIISFTRNFGHQAALMAGLKAATGDVVVSLDADLQHPPSFIPQLLAKYESGYDIVLTQRVNDITLPWFKKATSNLFYKVINLFADRHIQESGSDFRLLTKEVVNALLNLPEKRIFLRGMVAWVGFKTSVLKFSSPPRKKGSSKYNFYSMIKLAMYGIVSFSTSPLYLSVAMSVLFSCATFIYGIYVLYVRFISGAVVEGWSSVIFVLLGMGSILGIVLSIMSVYLAAIYDEVKQRPPYLINTIRLQEKPEKKVY